MKMIKEMVEQVMNALGLPATEFSVTHPKEEKNGDYSTSVALIIAKQLGKNPRELAEKIVDQLGQYTNEPMSQFVEKTEVAGPGFINFTLKPEFFLEEAKKAIEEGYGKNESGKGKLAIVEYSSPNIAKPFTIGHLRSTVIGDAIANLLEFSGWKVLRDNHLGDWGTQFGKLLYAICNLGEGSKVKNVERISSAENPVKELVKLYIEFHEKEEKIGKEDGGLLLQESGDNLLLESDTISDKAREWFKKLEDGDQEARELWQKCIDWSWKEFSRIYEILDIHHSDEFNGGRGLGESFFEDKMGEVVKILEKHDWYKEGKEGAKLVFFPNDKYSPAMILKKDGATLYHTRDLATDKYRVEKYKPDLVVNEVGMEQQLYFQQLYEIERMLGWYSERQRMHVMHGMYRWKDGKMSTRKGNVVWLEEILDEAIKRAGELQKTKREWGDTEVVSESEKHSKGARGHLVGVGEGINLAKQVGIGALKWNDLKGEARRDIIFDWEEILNMKGNSGPFAQYTYARARSILRKVKSANQQIGVSVDQLVSAPAEQEMSILRWLYRYPEVVSEAGERFAPHLVATYVYELAQRFNTFYQACRVEESGKVNELRYLLTQAVAQVLKSGLGLLGIQAPEEM